MLFHFSLNLLINFSGIRVWKIGWECGLCQFVRDIKQLVVVRLSARNATDETESVVAKGQLLFQLNSDVFQRLGDIPLHFSLECQVPANTGQLGTESGIQLIVKILIFCYNNIRINPPPLFILHKSPLFQPQWCLSSRPAQMSHRSMKINWLWIDWECSPSAD